MTEVPKEMKERKKEESFLPTKYVFGFQVAGWGVVIVVFNLSHGGHVHGGAGGLRVLGPPEAGHSLDLGEEVHTGLAVEVQVTANGGC